MVFSTALESIGSFSRPGRAQFLALGLLLAIASRLELVRWYQDWKKDERDEQTDEKIVTEERAQDQHQELEREQEQEEHKIATEERAPDQQQELERKQEQEHESGSAINIQDDNPVEEQKIVHPEVINVPESATESAVGRKVHDDPEEEQIIKMAPESAKERRSEDHRQPEASEKFIYRIHRGAGTPADIEGNTFDYGSPFHIILGRITETTQGMSPRGLVNDSGTCFVNACLQMIRSSPVLMEAFREGVIDMMDSCPNQLRIPAVDGMIIFLEDWKYVNSRDQISPWSIMRYVTHNQSNFKYDGNGGYAARFLTDLLSAFDSEFRRYRPWKQPMLDCLSIVRPNEDDCCHHPQSGYMNNVRLSHSIQNQLNAGDPCLKLPRAILVHRVNFMDRGIDDDDCDNLIEETLQLRRDETRPGWIGHSEVQYQLRSVVLFRPNCVKEFNHALAAVRSQGTSQQGESLWILCDDHIIHAPMTLSAVLAIESIAQPYVLLYERQ